MTAVRTTVCNRDCPDTCRVHVTMDGDRPLRLGGDPDDPVTRGFLCERTRRFLTRQMSPDRITSPRRRQGKQWVDISWDEAFEEIANRLRLYREESGAASILHYRSGGSLGILKGVVDLFFQLFGPVSVKGGDICSGAGERAQALDFGMAESHDLHDLLNSRTILLWGKNPHTSGVHLIPVLKEAQDRGARILGIDPVRTKAAHICDRFYQVQPGGDYALAMAIAQWMFEHGTWDSSAESYCQGLESYRELVFSRSFDRWVQASGLSVEDVTHIAESYSQGPSAILVGWGLSRRRYGSRSVRAIDALGAISGNLGRPGGGVSFYFGRRNAFDLSFGFHAEPPPRELSEALLGEAILDATDPPVRMIWVTGGNPVSMLPEAKTVRQAFEKTEFVVVVETHPTDTTDMADLVLPTLTLLEDEDVFGAYGNHYLRASTPVLPPPGQARHELSIFQELARRVGMDEFASLSLEDWKNRAMTRLSEHGITPQRLREEAIRSPFVPQVLFEDRRFATPSGKVELLGEDANVPESSAGDNDDYPLSLLAASVPDAQASQRSRDIPDGPQEVRVHPDSRSGFEDGDIIWVESAQGRLEATLRVDVDVVQGVALMAKGGMRRDVGCPNDLIRAEETDDGGGAVYYDEPVRLSAR